MNGPVVSVVIPTYDRQESLRRTLASLTRQTYRFERFEVIVVDDGSHDATDSVATTTYPFSLRYVRQANQGATAARNHGAELSQGRYLVFADDDIEMAAGAIQNLIAELQLHSRTIVLGTLNLPSSPLDPSAGIEPPEFSQADQQGANQGSGSFVCFHHCMTGLLAIHRQDFFSLGMFQDPTGGWPNWDDVDFGYRASLEGFQFWRSANAVARHWDRSATMLRLSADRWYSASKVAPLLFQKHPGLYEHLTMFHYKSPIVWGQDSPLLVIRKLVRQCAWSSPFMWATESIASLLEDCAPESRLFELLSRFVSSGYIYRGYRDGIRNVRCAGICDSSYGC